jgi:hypothetical protein
MGYRPKTQMQENIYILHKEIETETTFFYTLDPIGTFQQVGDFIHGTDVKGKVSEGYR